MKSRRWLVASLVIVAVAIAVGGWLLWRSTDDDPCSRPVSERTGGWFCFEPAQSGSPGTVHGQIMYTGGPAGASPQSAAGTVVLSQDGHEIRQAAVGANQEYSFSVVAGAYVLIVKGVDGACVHENVTIEAGADTQRDLICSRK